MQPYGCLKNTSLIVLVEIQRVCNPPAMNYSHDYF